MPRCVNRATAQRVRTVQEIAAPTMSAPGYGNPMDSQLGNTDPNAVNHGNDLKQT